LDFIRNIWVWPNLLHSPVCFCRPVLNISLFILCETQPTDADETSL